jgi:hypothetical protein
VVGGWWRRIDNKANSVQFQVKLPTGTELGNRVHVIILRNA